jgi:tetratricopeptide (TPR) repeat protein
MSRSRRPYAVRSLVTMMMRLVVACGSTTLALSASHSTAHPRIEPPTPLATLAVQADTAYQARDWTRAVPLYERLAHEQPEGYLYWMRLGTCLHGIGENAQALKAYETAKSHGAPPSDFHYGIAITLASMGKHDEAFAALTEAVRAGHGRPDLMRSDPDLVRLRSDARFPSLIAQAERNQAPCDYRSESRQFDFWLGDWNVVSTHELSPAGRSHIERTVGNCVIWENWTSHGESGYAGKSYNIYNVDLKRWEQFWVDNRGDMTHFHGGLVDGVMDLSTDAVPQADGKALTRRLRFYNLGANRVRQLGEASTDGGKTWTDEYDFTYQRVE